jgi:hypothetical protein
LSGVPTGKATEILIACLLMLMGRLTTENYDVQSLCLRAGIPVSVSQCFSCGLLVKFYRVPKRCAPRAVKIENNTEKTAVLSLDRVLNRASFCGSKFVACANYLNAECRLDESPADRTAAATGAARSRL